MQVLCKRQLVRPFALRTVKTQEKKEEGKKVHSDMAAIGRRPRGEWVWPHSPLLCPAQVIYLICFFSRPPQVFSFCWRRDTQTGYSYWDDSLFFWDRSTCQAVLTFSGRHARKCDLGLVTPNSVGNSCRAKKKKKREWDGNNWIHRSERTVALNTNNLKKDLMRLKRLHVNMSIGRFDLFRCPFGENFQN